MCKDRTRGNGFKQKRVRFISCKNEIVLCEGDEAQEQLAQRSCRCVPSLFKARLDGTLRNFVEWKVSLLIVRGLELDDLQVPSSPGYFMTLLDERRKSLNS